MGADDRDGQGARDALAGLDRTLPSPGRPVSVEPPAAPAVAGEEAPPSGLLMPLVLPRPPRLPTGLSSPKPRRARGARQEPALAERDPDEPPELTTLMTGEVPPILRTPRPRRTGPLVAFALVCLALGAGVTLLWLRP